ncbi:hypothetical protein HPB50_003374 [Hyalomma asiaticum]|uniref:Uncharacterized protein n=1 Tax=Hyalomma asiaticum TaxID=266040 RepID=A0ACB7TCE5_HYAAI|nr:hypothetical protein HPB50_003374 [Hyalomma asiaticum]
MPTSAHVRKREENAEPNNGSTQTTDGMVAPPRNAFEKRCGAAFCARRRERLFYFSPLARFPRTAHSISDRLESIAVVCGDVRSEALVQRDIEVCGRFFLSDPA